MTPSGRSSALPGTSLQRLAGLSQRVMLPAHGPIAADTASALTAALRRAQRLVDHPDGAVWYAARRIFAYALMIRGGIPTAQIERYLHQRAWLTDAARLLDRAPDALAAELVESMLRSGPSSFGKAASTPMPSTHPSRPVRSTYHSHAPGPHRRRGQLRTTPAAAGRTEDPDGNDNVELVGRGDGRRCR